MKDILVHRSALIAILSYLKAFNIIQSISCTHTLLNRVYCHPPQNNIPAIKSFNISALASRWAKTVIDIRGFLPLFRNGVKRKINGIGHAN